MSDQELGDATYVVHGIEILLVVSKVESAEPGESLRFAMLRLKSFRFVAVGLLEQVRHPEHFVLDGFLARHRSPLVLAKRRLVGRTISDSPPESSIHSTIPSEFS